MERVRLEGIQRDGRKLTDMVYDEVENSEYDEVFGGIMFHSINDDFTFSGYLAEDDDHPSYEVSIGFEDLSSEDVKAYIEEFYDDQVRVQLSGEKGVRGDRQIKKWADEEGKPRRFSLMFDADPVDQEGERTGQLHFYLANYDSWDEQSGGLEETINTVNEVLHGFDREELSNQEVRRYWNNVLDSNQGLTSSLKKNLPMLEDPDAFENLPDIVFENPDDVRPEVSELISAYEELREKGWQPEIHNSFDFTATDHELTAHAYDREEFNKRVSWIEEQLDVPRDAEFTLDITID